MRRHVPRVLFILLFIQHSCIAQLQPIGTWQDHFPYTNAIAVTHTSNLVWGATMVGLIRFESSTNTVERKSKVNGLAEARIATFGADSASGLLVVAYANSKVDLLVADRVHTLTDIYASNLPADKSIHHVFIDQQKIYLSCGFGIVVIDAGKQEISDTYIIGSNGQRIAVYETTILSGYLYAATAEGMKRVALNAVNPADFASWETLFQNGSPVLQVFAYAQQLVFRQQDTLYTWQNGNRNLFYAGVWNVTAATVSGGKLLVTERLADQGRISEISPSGTVTNSIMHSYYTAFVKQAIYAEGRYWIADSMAGISSYKGSTFESLALNAPAGTALGELHYGNETVWAAGGSITATRQPENNPNGFYFFRNHTWTNINRFTIPALDTFRDIITIAPDPVDDAVWAGSFGGGLAHLQNGQVTIYKQNSGLESDMNAPGNYRVSGLAFDTEGNLWIANEGAAKPLVVKKKNNAFQQFTLPFTLPANALSRIVIDDNNQKWIIAPGNGLLVFNHGRDIDNTADDRYKLFRAGMGNGNLPDNEVLSIAKDKNGFIWVGTVQGIGIIPCAGQVFSNNACEFFLPVVQQDNFAGYLFREERVQAIAVDGADRKWIGTRNGAWLISAEGDRTLLRFTTANSPLPDNDIRGITVNGKTGEVFFSTTIGIYSYRADATEPAKDPASLFIFPNPVPPGYTGIIAIRGVAANSVVKITEPDGRLVFQMRANGGQAVWNGKDYHGRTVAGGVYLVLVADETKTERLAGKIIFIKK